MAITNIKGTVTRVFYNGRGAEVTETFTKRDGEEGKTRWTCWFEDAHGLLEGAEVTVSGMHGDQVDEWTDKQGVLRYSVKRSINGAKVGKESGSSGSVRQSGPVSEPWATSTHMESPTPQTDAWHTPSTDEMAPF
jgi:hypothetical protein